MIPRKSSGSSRDDSAVEPTRSQNITVSCRRSGSLLGARITVVSLGGPVGSLAGLVAKTLAKQVGDICLVIYDQNARGSRGLP